jgi:hypothetical protein
MSYSNGDVVPPCMVRIEILVIHVESAPSPLVYGIIVTRRLLPVSARASCQGTGRKDDG